MKSTRSILRIYPETDPPQYVMFYSDHKMEATEILKNATVLIGDYKTHKPLLNSLHPGEYDVLERGSMNIYDHLVIQ